MFKHKVLFTLNCIDCIETVNYLFIAGIRDRLLLQYLEVIIYLPHVTGI